jgi:transcriptional regulator with XRE-family HTH domain
MDEPGISTSLKAARERLGWSREELAYHSGISWSAIAQIESGRRTDIRLSSLDALARALGVPADYLGGRITSTPPRLLQHRALVYRSTEEFLGAVVPFLREGIERSDALLVVATAEHVAAVRESLGRGARQVDFAGAGDWYSTTALETVGRFRAFIDKSLDAGARWVRTVGEPALAGRSRAQVRAWLRTDSLINLRLASAPATLVCAFDASSLPASVVRDVAHTHPELTGADGSAESPTYREPEDFLLG